MEINSNLLFQGERFKSDRWKGVPVVISIIRTVDLGLPGESWTILFEDRTRLKQQMFFSSCFIYILSQWQAL